MLLKTDGTLLGMQAMLPFFQVLPLADVLYQNFLFPGIALLLVNGVPNLVAFWLLRQNKRVGMVLGGCLGVTLMLWICIQFYIFPLNVMSTAYFVFGLLQAATGYAAHVFWKQETFAAAPQPFADACVRAKEEKTAQTLVVYFSRMGYTRRYALALAQARGADVLELRATERTQGTLGFWWCGRFAMHRWAMPIEPFEAPLEQYETVILCTPIWIFRMCAPMRSFCTRAAGRVRHADYVLVHYRKTVPAKAIREMDALLGVTHDSALSLCVRQGREVRCDALDGNAGADLARELTPVC